MQDARKIANAYREASMHGANHHSLGHHIDTYDRAKNKNNGTRKSSQSFGEILKREIHKVEHS